MRKHFLLLLLMTLLPLVGWAASADLATKPSLATGLTYDGTAQALTTGSYALPGDYDTSVGRVLWAVTTTSAAPEATAECVTFPNVKAINAGKYWVWYKVLADGDEYVDDGVWTQIGTSFVRINKAQLEFTAATPATGLIYDGQSHALFTAPATANFGTVQYSILDTTLETPAWSEWTNDIATLTETNAGSYSVKWQIAEKDDADFTANLSDDATAYSGTFANVVIASATITAEIDGTPAFTFNGQEQTPTIIVKSGETTLTPGTDYNITYWTDETRNTTQVAAPTDAKTYYILVSGINNYADHNVATLSYAIAKKSLADEDVTAVVKNDYINKTYKGEAITGYAAANLTVKAYVGTDNVLTLNSTMYDRKGYENNIDVPAADAPDNLKPRFKVVGKGNFTGERYVYFNIVPRSLNDVTISADLEADKTYTGLQITPSTEDKLVYTNATPTDFTLVENTDFTVAYGENKVVAKNEEGAVVNGGTITITGTGNYTGEVVKNFKIQPAELTVNAKNFSKNLGTADPTSDELVAGNYYEITGYVNEETATTAGVTGVPTFAIANHPETTGTHSGVISISAVTGLSAANYSFVEGAAANLIIGQGSVTVAATDTEETYGYKLPTLDKDAFGFTATGLVGAEAITALTFTVKDANNHEYVAGDMLEAGEYTITPSAATATSNSYVFEYTPATLTIKPYKLQIVAQDQTINYGSEPNLTSITNTYVKMYNVNAEPKTLITQTAFEGLYGVWKPDFIDSREWVVADNHPLAEPGTIKVNLKADYDSKNFEVETVVGHVTYNDLGGLVLTSTDADLAAIEAQNGNAVNVKIDFSLRNNRELPVGTARKWEANTWVTMTLPFDISVADLSKKLGYAIVNVIDPSRTTISGTGSKFYGKLTMKGGNGYVDPTDPDNDAKKDTKLAANKPFMVKTADAITGIVDFGTQTIVAPDLTDAYALTVEAGGGAKFTGTYAPKAVTGDDNAKIWFMVGNSDQWLYIGAGKSHVWNILPFEGFIDMNGSSARNMTFYFEEIDGSTTAIRNVDVDDLNGKIATEGMYNLNGMKLNTVPTQKGVYILNGKKVVIK